MPQVPTNFIPNVTTEPVRQPRMSAENFGGNDFQQIGKIAGEGEKISNALQLINFYGNRATARDALNDYSLGFAENEAKVLNDPNSFKLNQQTGKPQGIEALDQYRTQQIQSFNNTNKDPHTQALYAAMVDRDFRTKASSLTIRFADMAKQADLRGMDASYRIGLLSGDPDKLAAANSLKELRGLTDDEFQVYKDDSALKVMQRVPVDQIPNALGRIEKDGGMTPMAFEDLKEKSMHFYETKAGNVAFKQAVGAINENSYEFFENGGDKKIGGLDMISQDSKNKLSELSQKYKNGEAVNEKEKPYEQLSKAFAQEVVAKGRQDYRDQTGQIAPKYAVAAQQLQAKMMNALRHDLYMADPKDLEKPNFRFDLLNKERGTLEWVAQPDGKIVQVPRYEKLWSGFNSIEKLPNNVDVMTLPNGKRIIYERGKPVGTPMPPEKDLRDDGVIP